jgi:hypothetical protein
MHLLPLPLLGSLIVLLACQSLPNESHATSPTSPSLSASLVDRDAKARKGWATVEVEVAGIELVDSPTGELRDGEGHLHYRVDDGLVIATTAQKLSFHALPLGDHRIEIRLVGNDHRDLGPVTTLDLTVTGSSDH